MLQPLFSHGIEEEIKERYLFMAGPSNYAKYEFRV